MEHLPDKSFKSQPQRKVALPAVEALLGAREKGRGQKVAQVLVELGEGGLAQALSRAAAQGGQAAAQGREERRIHHKAGYIRPCLTASLKWGLYESTRDRSEEHTLNSSHGYISYAVFCLKKKKRRYIE